MGGIILLDIWFLNCGDFDYFIIIFGKMCFWTTNHAMISK